MNLNMSGLIPPAAKEAPLQPQKEVALKVATSEVKNVRIRSADSESKMIDISKPVFYTLLNTATFNIEIFNEIPEAQRPAILKDFTEALKHYKPSTPELQKELTNIDFKDKAKVKKLAEDFLMHGGGEAVLATFKVMEWEASLLHGASGARFEGKGPKTASKPGETDIIFTDPQTGVLTTQKIDSRNWFTKKWDGLFGEKDVRGERQLKINTILTTGVGSQIVDVNNVAYLNKCGWVNGTNIQTVENREVLFKRLYSVAQARSELFSETGLTATEVSQRLNFVDNAGNLITTGRGAHLIGETSGGYTPAEFTAEVHTITNQIKTATVEKLSKAKKEKADQRVGDQIDKKITDLNKTKDMTPEEILAEQAVIDQEIKKTQAEADLFTRKKLLPGEIAEAQKIKDETFASLDVRAGQISQTRDDILKWAGDNSEPESWVSIQAEFDNLTRQKTRIQTRIDKRVEELDKHYSHEPKVDIDETVDSKKGITKKPNNADVERVKNWNKRTKVLEDDIDKLRKSFEEDNYGITTKTLDVLIAEKEDLYIERKKIVEDNDDTKTLINKYKETERLLKQKTDEQGNLDTKTAALKVLTGTPPVTETDIQAETRLREEIKKKLKEKESVGKASLDDQREVGALSLIKEVIVDPEKKATMEQRLLEQESGAYDELEFSPELKDYPQVVLQAVKLMFGPEALSSAGETPLYKQTKALLESKWYIKIIIEQIEAQNSITNIANKVVIPGGTRPRGGQNTELTMADLVTAIGTKPVETLTAADVNEKTIRKIIDEIRKSALGYI